MGEAPGVATPAMLTLTTGGRHRTRDGMAPEPQDKCKRTVSETPTEQRRTNPLDPTYAYDTDRATGTASEDDKAAVRREVATMQTQDAHQQVPMTRTDEGVGYTPGEAHTRTDDDRYEEAAGQVQEAEDEDLEYRISEWDECRVHGHEVAEENATADDCAADTQSPTQTTGELERGAVPFRRRLQTPGGCGITPGG